MWSWELFDSSVMCDLSLFECDALVKDGKLTLGSNSGKEKRSSYVLGKTEAIAKNNFNESGKEGDTFNVCFGRLIRVNSSF